MTIKRTFKNTLIYFLLSLAEERNLFLKNFDFRFSKDLYVLEGHQHNLMNFRKCQSATLYQSLCASLPVCDKNFAGSLSIELMH